MRLYKIKKNTDPTDPSRKKGGSGAAKPPQLKEYVHIIKYSCIPMIIFMKVKKKINQVGLICTQMLIQIGMRKINLHFHHLNQD